MRAGKRGAGGAEEGGSGGGGRAGGLRREGGQVVRIGRIGRKVRMETFLTIICRVKVASLVKCLRARISCGMPT